MINTTDFSKRLKKVIDYYGESSSSFAEKISVQRSSISHILSGRNKPSLEFVLKVLSVFPEVELYWLLNGKGKFPSSQKTLGFENEVSKVEPEKTTLTETKSENYIIENGKSKTIERIVIFYSDGSFKNFENQ